MCKAVHEMTGLEVLASTLCRVIDDIDSCTGQVAKQRSNVHRGQFMVRSSYIAGSSLYGSIKQNIFADLAMLIIEIVFI